MIVKNKPDLGFNDGGNCLHLPLPKKKTLKFPYDAIKRLPLGFMLLGYCPCKYMQCEKNVDD